MEKAPASRDEKHVDVTVHHVHHPQAEREVQKSAIRELGSVPEPTARPQAGPHPEEVDPLGRSAPRHHERPDPADRYTLFVLAILIIISLVAIPIIAAISNSPLLNVFLGLSPLILTLIAAVAVTRGHFKSSVMWMALIVIHLLALAYLYVVNLGLFTPVNVAGSVSLSAMAAVASLVLVTLAGARELPKPRPGEDPPQDFHAEELAKYVQSIEDKAKGLNFCIGRVYRSSNGGTPAMRERLRVPSEWYNQFNGLKDAELKEQVDEAKVLVRHIRDRLQAHASRERDIFTTAELSKLKNIVRDPTGNDAVIEVLKANDNDPVDHYYVSAVEFCETILKELEER